MVMMLRSHNVYRTTLLLGTMVVALGGFATNANSQNAGGRSPSLIITSGPLPESLRKDIYTKPIEVKEIEAKDIINNSYYDGSNTIVAAEINKITSGLANIQGHVASLSGRLKDMQRLNQDRSAEYYANVATINTQLQNGTTPGNPRLVQKLNGAEGSLEAMAQSVSSLNGLAVETSNAATEASYLLEATRAAYSVAGAVEEDHVRLTEVEDSINNTIIVIDRVLNSVNEDITRLSAYLAAERSNLRTLSLGVTNGDLFGTSMANRPFAGAPLQQAAYMPAQDAVGMQMTSTNGAAVAPVQSSVLNSPRLLAKVKFDRPDVDYEQAIFVAVNEALERYPNARFDLVAVNPSSGNAAEVAIETTRARRNAEDVFRSLTQMGLSPDQIDLAYNASPQASSSEVHLFVK